MLEKEHDVSKTAKVNIGGTLISNFSVVELTDYLNHTIIQNRKIRICVTPVNCIVWANKSPELQNIYNTADISICDGVPVRWASKFLGTPLKERITGLDFFPSYVEECYKKGFSFFLLGAKEGVAEVLYKKFSKKYPGIKIHGYYSPPFAEKFSEDENKKMLDLINKTKPNVLWVSLTAPKQDYWIYENLNSLNVNIAIGVGGAFDVTAGLIKRAPIFMQKYGLEWLYRFIKEPKRLYKRYFVEAPQIFSILFRQKREKNSSTYKL